MNRKDITVETRSGIKKLWLFVRNNEVTGAKVDMGAPSFDAASVPVRLDGEVIDREVVVGGGKPPYHLCIYG